MITYKDAGVDVERGYEAVKRMKQHVQKTFDENVLGGLGSFGGFYSIENEGLEKPVLVAGTDGVGTKLKLAFLMDKHDTVGIDCVAMCVNDVICCGAQPLFFLDYVAVGKNVPSRVADIVSGVAEGCVQAGCALIGGETAEMPGFYPEDEYDLAGFAVGMVDKAKMVDCSSVKPGDAILALPSSGIHSNGFSLVRRALDVEHADLARHVDELGMTLGEALLAPTKIYVKPLLALMREVTVKSVSHITGGGFYENIPRSLPRGCCARIAKADIVTPPIFRVIQKAGDIPERDMYNTYNMGVGMSLIVDAADADRSVEVLRRHGEQAYIMGVVATGEGGVELC